MHTDPSTQRSTLLKNIFCSQKLVKQFSRLLGLNTSTSRLDCRCAGCNLSWVVIIGGAALDPLLKRPCHLWHHWFLRDWDCEVFQISRQKAVSQEYGWIPAVILAAGGAWRRAQDWSSKFRSLFTGEILVCFICIAKTPFLTLCVCRVLTTITVPFGRTRRQPFVCGFWVLE